MTKPKETKRWPLTTPLAFSNFHLILSITLICVLYAIRFSVTINNTLVNIEATSFIGGSHARTM